MVRRMRQVVRHYDYLVCWSPTYIGPLAYRHTTMSFGQSAKCPCCQQYSLTYDFARDAYLCHVYGGIITAKQLSQVTQS